MDGLEGLDFVSAAIATKGKVKKYEPENNGLATCKFINSCSLDT